MINGQPVATGARSTLAGSRTPSFFNRRDGRRAMGRKEDYAEKLRDPRWQRKRLEVFQRDGWKCTHCGRTDVTLNVHHEDYIGSNPWDTPNENLTTICVDCHSKEHKISRHNIVGNARPKWTNDAFYALGIIACHPILATNLMLPDNTPNTMAWVRFRFVVELINKECIRTPPELFNRLVVVGYEQMAANALAYWIDNQAAHDEKLSAAALNELMARVWHKAQSIGASETSASEARMSPNERERQRQLRQVRSLIFGQKGQQ